MFKAKDTAQYQNILKGKKVPLVVLDTKWYQLFDDGKVPGNIKSMQTELNDLLKRQGKINTELKDLRRIKSDLLKQIMENMGVAEAHIPNPKLEKKLDENKRLIREINEKIEKNEDELYEIPKAIADVNKLLVIATMEICYSKLQNNKEEIDKINTWIEDTRDELKKNIVLKQDKEMVNTAIYSYLHDILGAEIVDLFDEKYGDDAKVMIVGIGMDMIENQRVKKACEKAAFLTRCFTKREQELIEIDNNKAAGNFASKEAVSKVLGTGFRGFGLSDIEILRDGLGKPYVVLYGTAKDLAQQQGINKIHLSITNTKEYTAAYAIGESV